MSEEQIAEARQYAKDLKYPRWSLVYSGSDEDDFLYCLPDNKGSHLRHCHHIPRTIGATSDPWHSVALQQPALLIAAFPKHVEQYNSNHPGEVLREQVMWDFMGHFLPPVLLAQLLKVLL